MKKSINAGVAALALATAFAAQADCNTGTCGGVPTTPPAPATPTQTTDVRNTIGITNGNTLNGTVSGTNTLNGTVSGSNTLNLAPGAVKGGNAAANATLNVAPGAVQGGSAAVNLAPGAVTGGTLNVAPGALQGGTSNLTVGAGSLSPTATSTSGVTGSGNSDSKSNASIGTVAPVQNTAITFAAPKTYRPVVNPAIPPTMIIGNGGGNNGVYDPANPYATCFREVTGKGTYAGAITLPFVSFSLGKANEKEDNAECIARVDGVLADQRLAASGRSGQAVVIRRDLERPGNVDLKKAVLANRDMAAQCTAAGASTGDAVDLVITGVCVPTPVTETVAEFNKAAPAAAPLPVGPAVTPQAEVCPAGTARAGKPALLNAQLGQYTCR